MKLARRSLTLIELLLVLTILAALAASAASFVEESDDQFRYQDTKNRLTSIRAGILGRSAGGTARIDGFVADVGRLPATIQELLDGTGIPSWEVDSAATGLGHGWRGPYLNSLPGTGGLPAYPDGWGNLPLSADPLGNHGWHVLLSGQDLVVQSRGLGGKDDAAVPPTSYQAKDYPSTPLVSEDDYSLDINGWRVNVRIESPSSLEVRLRLRYYTESAGARTLVTHLSKEVDLGTATLGAQPFRFDLGGQTRVPWGLKAFDLVESSTGNAVANVETQHVLLWPRATLGELPVGWSP